jgi:gas vesicle protein GvpL/GvpF
VVGGYTPETGGLRTMRHDMRAHSALLNKLVEVMTTVLPFGFGIVLPSEAEVISRVLKPQHDVFVKHLNRLEGKVELTLRATYVEASVLAEAVAESPQLAQSGAGNRSRGYHAKIEVGRRVAARLKSKQAEDERALVAALRPFIREMILREPAADLMVLNAAILIDRAMLPKFDRALEKLAKAQYGRIRFDCLGPLPAYSFVDIRL